MMTRLKHAVRDQPVLRAGALRAGAMVRSVERAAPGIYTLCYHHVAPAAQASFERQILSLQRHGTFITPDAALTLLASGEACAGRSFVITFDDGYLDNLEVALPVLARHAIPAMQFLVSDWLDAPPPDGNTYMDRRHVDRWLAAGLEIGSHSASHRQIAALSHDEAEAEFGRSAEALRAVLGAPVRHFACPWGVAVRDYQPVRDVALARAAGYDSFFTTRRGKARSMGDRMAMPRHVLEPEWPLFHLESLLGGWMFARG